MSASFRLKQGMNMKVTINIEVQRVRKYLLRCQHPECFMRLWSSRKTCFKMVTNIFLVQNTTQVTNICSSYQLKLPQNSLIIHVSCSGCIKYHRSWTSLHNNSYIIYLTAMVFFFFFWIGNSKVLLKIRCLSVHKTWRQRASSNYIVGYNRG